MRLAVATEALDAPIAHVPLLEPGQTLAAAGRACSDAAVLAPSLSVNAVAGRDYGVDAKRHASGQTDKLELVEDRAVALVVDDQRSKLPAHDLAPMAADVVHQVADGAGLRITDQPLVVGPDQIPCAILTEANLAGGQREPDGLAQISSCGSIENQRAVWQVDVQVLVGLVVASLHLDASQLCLV